MRDLFWGDLLGSSVMRTAEMSALILKLIILVLEDIMM